MADALYQHLSPYRCHRLASWLRLLSGYTQQINLPLSSEPNHLRMSPLGNKAHEKIGVFFPSTGVPKRPGEAACLRGSSLLAGLSRHTERSPAVQQSQDSPLRALGRCSAAPLRPPPQSSPSLPGRQILMCCPRHTPTGAEPRTNRNVSVPYSTSGNSSFFNLSV